MSKRVAPLSISDKMTRNPSPIPEVVFRWAGGSGLKELKSSTKWVLPCLDFQTWESTDPPQPSFSLHKIPLPRLTMESSRLKSPARRHRKAGTPPIPPLSGGENARPSNPLQMPNNCIISHLQHRLFAISQLHDPSIPCKNHTKPCNLPVSQARSPSGPLLNRR
jgi:hypothetical protein